MSKIDLFKTVEEFNSSIVNLNNPTSPEMVNFKKRYADTQAQFEELNSKTHEAVNAWKESRLKKDPSAEPAPVDTVSVRSKAKLIKHASLGVQIISAYTSLIALIFLVSSSFYLSSALWTVGIALTALAVYQSKKKPIDVKTLSMAEKAEKAIRSLSYRLSLLLNQFEIIRQNRLNESQNFKKFIAKFVQTDSKVNEQALLNKQLHVLYLKYKFYVKEIIDEKAPLIHPIG